MYGVITRAGIVAEFQTLLKVTMPPPKAQDEEIQHLRPCENGCKYGSQWSRKLSQTRQQTLLTIPTQFTTFVVRMPSSPGADAPPAQKLFASVRYFIVSSMPVQRADQLRHILDINGAVYLEKGSLDTALNTVITNSHRFEGWENVVKREQVRVVSDKWVERSVILGKMQL